MTKFRYSGVTSHSDGGTRSTEQGEPRWRLLNRHSSRNARPLPPPISLLLALFIGRALASGDLVERVPLRFHPEWE